MKKLILLLMLLALFIASPVYGASSCSVGTVERQGHLVMLPLDWVAHTDGSFTTWTTPVIRGFITHVQTDPGGTAPQALYDITLKNSQGYDVMGGALGNRSATATECTRALMNGGYQGIDVNDTLSLAITGNNVNTAIGEIRIYYYAY